MGKPANAIQEFAVRCRTPRQYRRLLEELRAVLPYRCLVCLWGNATTHVIGNMVDVDYPRHYLGWYLANGMCRKDPAYQEWLRTQQPQIRSDVMTRLRHQFDPQHIKRIEQYNLEHEFEGGILDQERVGYFSLVFRSEGEAHAYLGLFGELLPALCRALMISYRYPLLSSRKKEILLWRAQGKSLKQIAHELVISPRTVKMHLEEIRKKLYAEDLVHAAWIAGHIGLIG